MDIKHILAILDPEHAPRQGASRAARRAVDIAARTGARVTLAVFEDHQTIVESGVLGDALTREALDLWRQETESWLGRMKDGLESDGEVALHVGGGHPLADHVLKSIDEMQADLVIKDSHSESFLSRALFTPLDWHLLRRCPVPLMLTKSDGRDGLARVAAAVDPFHERGKPAELDQDILATAKSVAGWFGADVHAVHACQTQPLGAGSPIEGPSLQFEKVRLYPSPHPQIQNPCHCHLYENTTLLHQTNQQRLRRTTTYCCPLGSKVERQSIYSASAYPVRCSPGKWMRCRRY